MCLQYRLQFQKSANLTTKCFGLISILKRGLILLGSSGYRISLIRNRTETLLTIFSEKTGKKIVGYRKAIQHIDNKNEFCFINLYCFSHNLNVNQILSKLAVIQLKIIMLMVIQKLHVKFADFLPKKINNRHLFQNQFLVLLSHFTLQ